MKRIAFALLLLLSIDARADKASDALALLDRGIKLFQEGQLEAARDAFVRARDLVPDKANPHRWLGLVYARMGKCDEAIWELESFIRRVPADDPRAIEAVTLRDRCRADLARPVVAEAPRPSPVPVAAPVPEEDKPKKPYWIAGVVVGGVAVIALAVGLGVGLSGASSSLETLPPIRGGN